MNKSYILIIALLFVMQIQAQQDPQYTQYMYNMNVLNPAYAGSTEAISIGALYRTQWNSLEGAPKTGTFSVHAPVGGQVGLGVSVIKDEIGPVSETNAYADFSYTIPLFNEHKLAFGIKAGATFHDIGLSNLVVLQQDDPLVSNINEVTPNIGAGAYFYKPNKYYAALSMPNLLNSVHLDTNGNKIGSEVQHLFAAAGYVFDLSDNFKLKPHGLLKMAIDSPVSFDLNANLFMYNFVEVGLGYRLDDSFSGMVNFSITPDIRIGYAYDNIVSDLNITTNASHEVFITFDIRTFKKISNSPRFF
ncbi:type IX secretion system membrane protein PorP/SprF [Winogradskyella sp. SYSU M77433]|uniref:PorP/SprF family type IX secretion system membrane protein n=1 Tax=Winogradskyella sp. SYSU M77433 TaxID=3042722 RepID=UPI002480505B|nr:type IX secretion system membrane protein PorP/SprF [Winogradskyella sp. SYSU M77433]MDH7911264.1 type IX secretion system membrane protein PorP/SprF [Winogradskyella sp. SYSU M77433]